MPQPVDLVAKRLDVLEMPVHRREAHVRHFVELVQLFHHDLADLARGHFALAEAAQLARDVADRFLDGLARYRPLLQRLEHAAAQLALVERHAALVALHHQRHHQLGGLERGEALAAGQAFAAAADLRALGREARVGDLGVVVRAEGTVHGTPSAGSRHEPVLHGP